MTNDEDVVAPLATGASFEKIVETAVDEVARDTPACAMHHHHHHHYYHTPKDAGACGEDEGSIGPRDGSFGSSAGSPVADARAPRPSETDGDREPLCEFAISREKIVRARNGMAVGSQWRVLLSLILCANVMDYHRTIVVFDEEELREMDEYANASLEKRRDAVNGRGRSFDANIYDYVFVPRESGRAARLTIVRNPHNVAIVHELDADATEDLRALAEVKRRSLRSTNDFGPGHRATTSLKGAVDDRARFLFTKVVRNVGISPFEKRQYFYKHVNTNVLSGLFPNGQKFKDLIDALWRSNRA